MPSRNPRPLIVALDVGTSSTRALLYDAHGRLQSDRSVQIKYPQHFTPDGGVECDADKLLSDTLTALKKMLASCSPEEKKRIAAVGISCFWHALMGVDGAGRAVTPVYSWADTRSSVELERLHQALDPKSYHERTGAFLHSSYWPSKVLWLRQSQPHLYDRIRRFISFPDYLMMRLCGRAVTSLSIASGTGLLNEADASWDEKTLKEISLDKEMMPEIAAPGETVTVSKKEIPALADVPCFLAYGDGACSNIGAGGVNDTRIVINISTSGAVRVLCPKPDRPIGPALFQYRMDDRRYVIGGAMSNGGNIYAWLLRTLQLGDDPAAAERRLAKAKPDGHGLTVLPFWAGERSPGWHAIASGSIVGLNLSTSPLDILQASMEGVAYTFRSLRRDILAAFPVATQLIVSGGAVENSVFLPKLLADVLNIPVRKSLDLEPSGRGAALAVAERIGALSALEKSPDRLSRPISPDPEAAKIYEAAHERYETLYKELIGRPLDAPTSKTEELLQSL
jgi:gluconokinase